MLYVKKTGNRVRAYELGSGSGMERELLREGTLRRSADGAYRLFSLEAQDGAGERAQRGDFFKVEERDGKRFPYPNAREWFLRNHRHIKGDEYECRSVPRKVWMRDDALCSEVKYLLRTGKLIITKEDPEKYYRAFSWNTTVSAPEDAALIFYRVSRNSAGEICDIDFGLSRREAFLRDYVVYQDCDAQSGGSAEFDNMSAPVA